MTPAAEQAWIARAEALGSQALALYGLLLVGLLAGVALLAWSADHMARRRRAEHPWVRLGLGVGLGFAFIVGAASLFAMVAAEVVDGGATQRIDQAFMDAVQRSMSDATRAAFEAITRLGDGMTLTVVCVLGTALLWWRSERVLALALVAAMGGNGLLNAALKSIFERVRPLDDQGLASADGWSFPSGHSSGALVGYGMLAYVLLRTLPRAWHLPAVLFASTIAFTVGASRVFVHAHFATDVVAGFASGSAWLAACIVSAELARGREGGPRA